MGLPPFILLLSPPATAIEARRWTAERAATTTQTRRCAAAGWVVRAVVGAMARGMWDVVQTEDVAIVGGTAVRVGEDFVGLREQGEGMRGVRIAAVGVGMVGFGEGEVGPGRLLVFASIMTTS